MKIRCLLLTLLSAFLLFLAVPNEMFIYGNPLFGIIALVPLFIAVRLSPSLLFSSLLGAVFGVSSTLLIYYWLMFFQDFSTWTVTGTALGYALYFAVFFPYLTFFSGLNRWVRPVMLAVAWTVFEYFKATGYLGFPWGLIPYPFNRMVSFIQIVDITGIWGLSFIIAFINGVIAEQLLCLSKPSSLHQTHRQSVKRLRSAFRSCFGDMNGLFLRNQWIAVGVLTALCFAYGTYRVNTEVPVRKKLSVLLVQQNIDSWLTGNEIRSLEIGQKLTRKGLKETERAVDLIIWSETALSRPLTEYREFFMQRPEGDPFLPFVKEMNTHLLIGAPYAVDWENYEIMNSVIMLSPDGTIVEHYGKQHPVPLAEHIPFYEVDAIKKFFTEVVGLYSGGWALGEEYTIFSVPTSTSIPATSGPPSEESSEGESRSEKGGPEGSTTVTFGTPICFEDAFPNICRRFILQGADLLINLTNDSWSKKVSAETQHYVVALFRAVETKRVLVRSTNGGVTAVIGPHGRALESLPLFTETYLSTTVPVYKEARFTPYTLYGDILPFICMGILIVTIVVVGIRRKSTLP